MINGGDEDDDDADDDEEEEDAEGVDTDADVDAYTLIMMLVGFYYDDGHGAYAMMMKIDRSIETIDDAVRCTMQVMTSKTRNNNMNGIHQNRNQKMHKQHRDLLQSRVALHERWIMPIMNNDLSARPRLWSRHQHLETHAC